MWYVFRGDMYVCKVMQCSIVNCSAVYCNSIYTFIICVHICGYMHMCMCVFA